MYGWTGSLLCLPCLDAGFFIGADHSDPLLGQSSGLFIQLEHWEGTREILFGFLNILPGMVAPGTDLLGYKKAPNAAGRDRRQARSSRHRACQCCLTPTRKSGLHEIEAGCKPALSLVRDPERRNDKVDLIWANRFREWV